MVWCMIQRLGGAATTIKWGTWKTKPTQEESLIKPCLHLALPCHFSITWANCLYYLRQLELGSQFLVIKIPWFSMPAIFNFSVLTCKMRIPATTFQSLFEKQVKWHTKYLAHGVILSISDPKKGTCFSNSLKHLSALHNCIILLRHFAFCCWSFRVMNS